MDFSHNRSLTADFKYVEVPKRPNLESLLFNLEEDDTLNDHISVSSKFEDLIEGKVGYIDLGNFKDNNNFGKSCVNDTTTITDNLQDTKSVEFCNMKDHLNAQAYKQNIIDEFLNDHQLDMQTFLKMSKLRSHLSEAFRNLIKTEELLCNKAQQTRVSAAKRFAEEITKGVTRAKTHRSRSANAPIIKEDKLRMTVLDYSGPKLVELSYNIHTSVQQKLNSVAQIIKENDKRHKKEVSALQSQLKSTQKRLNKVDQVTKKESEVLSKKLREARVQNAKLSLTLRQQVEEIKQLSSIAENQGVTKDCFQLVVATLKAHERLLHKSDGYNSYCSSNLTSKSYKDILLCLLQYLQQKRRNNDSFNSPDPNPPVPSPHSKPVQTP